MGNESPSRNPLSGIKVMVIDDSNTIRRSAEIFLLQAGCTVILAEDGFDALAKIADHQPDLVFVDIMMPRLDCPGDGGSAPAARPGAWFRAAGRSPPALMRSCGKRRRTGPGPSLTRPKPVA